MSLLEHPPSRRAGEVSGQPPCLPQRAARQGVRWSLGVELALCSSTTRATESRCCGPGLPDLGAAGCFTPGSRCAPGAAGRFPPSPPRSPPSAAAGRGGREGRSSSITRIVSGVRPEAMIRGGRLGAEEGASGFVGLGGVGARMLSEKRPDRTRRALWPAGPFAPTGASGAPCWRSFHDVGKGEAALLEYP